MLSLLFIKNKLQEATFKPLDHALVMDIFKKAKKDNFAILKQVSTAATNIAMQMGSKQVDPAMVKAYLESPESPLNPIQSFEANYQKVCESMNVTCNHLLIQIPTSTTAWSSTLRTKTPRSNILLKSKTATIRPA